MAQFFFVLFIMWIIFCLIGILLMIPYIQNKGKKFKFENWIIAVFVIVLLFVGMDWGFEHAQSAYNEFSSESSQSQAN